MAVAQNMPGIGAPISDQTGYVTPAWRNFFVTLFNRTGGGTDVIADASFIGEVKAYAGSSPPSSWLTCDGSILSRTTYAALFAVIGTLYGAGDGSTTFSIPDLRGRNIIGAGNGVGLSQRILGASGGVESVTLSTTQMPSHTHAVTDPGHAHGVADPGHTHSSAVTASNATAGSAAGATSGTTGSSVTGVTVNPNTTGITLANAGGADSVPIVQPFGVINFIIRVQ